jgi:hypothetical protein
MKDDQPHDKVERKGIGRAFRYVFSVAGWLYLARVSLLGLVLLIGMPLGAHGSLRALAIGVFDLHLLPGAFMVGFMLPFAAWATFVTGAMVFVYGARRSRFDVELPPDWILPAWRCALGVAVIANLWTIFAATDASERVRIISCVAAGIVVGLMLVAVIEELHRRASRRWVGGSLYLFPIGSQKVSMKDVAKEQEARYFKAAAQPEDWLMRGYRERDGEGSWEWMPGHRLLFWGSVVFFAVNIAIYNFSYENETEMTALIYLLVLFTMAILIGGGVSFFLDAYRLPFVSACIAWLWFVGRTDDSDHYYRIWAQRPVVEKAGSKDAEPLTPAQLLAKAVQARRPIVLVAIAGGGIQSSAWGTRVLTGLEEAFEAARKSGQLDAEFPNFAGSVQCISGVSGGATGAMFFVAAYGDGGLPSPRPNRPRDQPPPPTPPVDAALLSGIVHAAEETSLGQAVWGLAYPDLRRAWFPFFTSNDYMDRAERMERKWAQNAAKHIRNLGEKLKDVSLASWQNDVREGRRPAIIFNGTMVETGDRICFSTAPPRVPIGGQREFTNGPVTDKTQGTQLYPGADVRIITAARLSATFPIISPAARPLLAGGPEAPKGREIPDAGENGLQHVVDGGYYENTGLGALAQWLDSGLSELVKDNSPDLPRSVLILQLEAFPAEPPVTAGAAVPQNPGGGGTLFQITSPLVALYNVRGAAHTASAERLIQALQQRWMLVPPPEATKPQDEKQPPEATNPRTCRIHLVRFTIPLLTHAPAKRHFWEPAWADAKSDEPPLSWHLRKVEMDEIKDAWNAFRDESVGLAGQAASKLPPGPSANKLPDDPGAWPVDNVISFLKIAQEEISQTRKGAAASAASSR